MKVLQYSKFKVTEEMLASKWTRFGNHIIDSIFSTLLILALTAGLVFIFDTIGYYEGVSWFEHISTLLDYTITYGLTLLYFIVLEFYFAKSIGKFITRTSVVLENGEKPSSREIIIRSFSRIVPFDALSFLGEGSYGWHDKWSKTYVVKDHLFESHKKAFEEYHELGHNLESDSGFSIENMGIERN